MKKKPEIVRPRILYIDIETAPMEVYTWGTFKQNIALNQIIKPWGILSAAWMWEGDKAPRYVDNRRQSSPRDDRALVRVLRNLLDEADIVVTQNGIDFDTRRIMARVIEYGYPPPSPFKQVDTKRIAKRIAWFPSNKLEWLAENLAGVKKSKHKSFPGQELWTQVLQGNVKAWREMEKYNRQDVVALRALYVALLPYAPTLPALGVYNDHDDLTCPRCGSVDLVKRGFSHLAAGKYQRYCCSACGGWARGAKLGSKSKGRTVLKTEG